MFRKKTVRCGTCQQLGHNRQTCGETPEIPTRSHLSPQLSFLKLEEKGTENSVSTAEAYQTLTNNLSTPDLEGEMLPSTFDEAYGVKLGTSLEDLREATFNNLTLTATRRKERTPPEEESYQIVSSEHWVDYWKFCEEEYETPEGETVTVRYMFDEFPEIRSTITRLLLPRLSTLLFYVARMFGLKKFLICQISYKKTTPNSPSPSQYANQNKRKEGAGENVQEVIYRVRKGRTVKAIRKVNGVEHAEGRPAVEKLNGYKEWYNQGKLSNLEGPAIEGGLQERWYVDGRTSHNESLCQKATSPETELEELYQLCTHPDPVVRKLAAHNPKSPPEWEVLVHIME